MDEVWADDQMARKASAEFLTKYLLNNPHVKVLNVNSPWGSGKSFFLERWAKMLEAKHVCVRFNAWETDYTSEPLVALIACIEEQVTDPTALESTQVGKGIINGASLLVKKAAPLIVKGLVRKFSGVELDELIMPGAEDTVDDVVKALVEDQSRTKADVAQFKSEVQRRLEQAAINKGLSCPAFIFIDELDRCRPTYAIELLERVKHFFELEDCRFIIASDSVQLAHSIKAVYGQGFSSDRYLNRFFDVEFKLDNSDLFALVKQLLPEINSMSMAPNVSGQVVPPSYRFDGDADVVYPQKNTVTCSLEAYPESALYVVGLVRYFGVELREIVNYLRQIKAAADSLEGCVNFFWLAFLVFYKNSKSESYGEFFIPEKGIAAFRDFNKSRRNEVNFSYNTSLETISDHVEFFWELCFADRREVMRMTPRGWRGVVQMAVINQQTPDLLSYKSVVDLAHRLK